MPLFWDICIDIYLRLYVPHTHACMLGGGLRNNYVFLSQYEKKNEGKEQICNEINRTTVKYRRKCLKNDNTL